MHKPVAALARLRGWHWRLLELTALKDCLHNAPKAYDRADSVAAHFKPRVDEQAHAPQPRKGLGRMDALPPRLGDAGRSSGKIILMETLQPLPNQTAVCEKYRTHPQPMLRHDRLGIALRTLDLVPINGLRIPAMSGSSGWFVYGGGEPSDDPDFYQPLCVTHIGKYCKIAIPFLCLPAGWRFQIDGDGYEDVWYDETLLTNTQG